MTDPTAPSGPRPGPLELDPTASDTRTPYRLLTVRSSPGRSLGLDHLAGRRHNLVPHSYFNLVSVDAPHVVLLFSRVKDTLRDLRSTGEFVIRLVPSDLVEPMNLTASDLPPVRTSPGGRASRTAPRSA